MATHVDVAPGHPAIAAAARWWADRLRRPVAHDNGDAFQSGFATALSLTLPPLPAVVPVAFEAGLRDSLAARYNAERCWCPDNPVWASAFRVVAVDYHPCRTLLDAYVAAGGSGSDGSLRFPIKTVMWVGPDEVRVRCGYRAGEEVVWRKPEGESQ